MGLNIKKGKVPSEHAKLPGRVDGIHKNAFVYFYLINSLHYPSGTLEINNLRYERDLKNNVKEALEIDRLFEERKTILLQIQSRMGKLSSYLAKEEKRVNSILGRKNYEN